MQHAIFAGIGLKPKVCSQMAKTVRRKLRKRKRPKPRAVLSVMASCMLKGLVGLSCPWTFVRLVHLILSNPSLPHSCDVNFMECFAGKKACTLAFRRAGLCAHSFEIQDDKLGPHAGVVMCSCTWAITRNAGSCFRKCPLSEVCLFLFRGRTPSLEIQWFMGFADNGGQPFRTILQDVLLLLLLFIAMPGQAIYPGRRWFCQHMPVGPATGARIVRGPGASVLHVGVYELGHQPSEPLAATRG